MAPSQFLSDIADNDLGANDRRAMPTPKSIQAYLDSGEEYDPHFDLNNDGVIDEKDIEIAQARADEYFKKYSWMGRFFETKENDSKGEPPNQTTKTKSNQKAENNPNKEIKRHSTNVDFDFWEWLKSIFGIQ